jgi:hypothetical protein
MRVYYRSSSVLVTDQAIEIRGTHSRTIAIDAIDHVYVVSSETRVPRRLVLSRLWPTLCATAILALCSVEDPPHGARMWLLVATAALLIGGLGLIIAPARTHPVHELWVVTNGSHSCLLRHPDRQLFGQLLRAVTRAREHHR